MTDTHRAFYLNELKKLPLPLLVFDGGETVCVTPLVEERFGVTLSNTPNVGAFLGRVSSDVHRRKIEDMLTGRGGERSIMLSFQTATEEVMPVDCRVSRDGDRCFLYLEDLSGAAWRSRMEAQEEKMAYMGRLASGVAHELTNPMSGISQNLEVIWRRLMMVSPRNNEVAAQCGVSFSQIADYLEKRGLVTMFETILELSIRSGGLVKDMLQFSGETNQHARLVQSVPDLLDHALLLVSMDYHNRYHLRFGDIHLSRNYETPNPRISCQAWKIQQAFINIVINAAEALVAASTAVPRIDLSITSRDDAVWVTIRDNGIGMDAQTSRRAFEPYFSLAKTGPVAGLGLAMAYYIIAREHGGRISLESIPGKGTVVSVMLPFDDKPEKKETGCIAHQDELV